MEKKELYRNANVNHGTYANDGVLASGNLSVGSVLVTSSLDGNMLPAKTTE